MAQTTIQFGLDFQRVRILPSVLFQQFSQSNPGTLDLQGGAADNTFAKALAGGAAVIFDAGLPYFRTGGDHTTDTACLIGRNCDIAVVANQTAEIRVFFGGVQSTSTSLMFSGSAAGIPRMMQTQDYPPVFVPNDLTKWTVWRNIVLHDRFFVPVLFNMAGVALTVYRMHVKFYDSQN